MSKDFFSAKQNSYANRIFKHIYNEKLYVEFENEASVNIVHRYKKNLAQGLRIFPWFPPALYTRFKALSDEAYQIRKVRQPFHQTDIRYESTDIALYKRIDRTYRWQKCEVEGLPDICIGPDLLTRPSGTPSNGRAEVLDLQGELVPTPSSFPAQTVKSDQGQFTDLHASHQQDQQRLLKI